MAVNPAVVSPQQPYFLACCVFLYNCACAACKSSQVSLRLLASKYAYDSNNNNNNKNNNNSNNNSKNNNMHAGDENSITSCDFKMIYNNL
jgi:hypothetical protein